MLENLGPWILPLIIIGVVVSWMKRVKNDERLVVFRLVVYTALSDRQPGPALRSCFRLLTEANGKTRADCT